MKQLILGLILVCPLAHAESDTAEVHFAAHFGTSYAIQTFAYGVSKQAAGMDNTDALIFAAVVTLTGTTLRQVLAAGDSPVNTTGILQNAFGVAASIGTCLMFDF